jgi:hypothetical protein
MPCWSRRHFVRPLNPHHHHGCVLGTVTHAVRNQSHIRIVHHTRSSARTSSATWRGSSLNGWLVVCSCWLWSEVVMAAGLSPPSVPTAAEADSVVAAGDEPAGPGLVAFSSACFLSAMMRIQNTDLHSRIEFERRRRGNDPGSHGEL